MMHACCWQLFPVVPMLSGLFVSCSADDLFQAGSKVDPILEEAVAMAAAATNQPAAAQARVSFKQHQYVK
jgi:hypothetical protein